MDKKIAFIGAGSLAEALISGILKAKVVSPEQIHVTNKSDAERLDYMKENYQVQCHKERAVVCGKADIIILAMKPKDAIASIRSIRDTIQENHLIISVIAGVTTETIEQEIAKDIPVIRVMPNTSATIGKSASAICTGTHANEVHLQLAEALFQTVGTIKRVDEDDMHIVTAVSGSGPAFIYYVVEAMEKAAIEAGLDPETASELLAQTVIGAGNMLKESGERPETLRKNITSPNGTTEAGIREMEQRAFQKSMMAGVEAARKRSIEISKEK